MCVMFIDLARPPCGSRYSVRMSALIIAIYVAVGDKRGNPNRNKTFRFACRGVLGIMERRNSHGISRPCGAGLTQTRITDS